MMLTYLIKLFHTESISHIPTFSDCIQCHEGTQWNRIVFSNEFAVSLDKRHVCGISPCERLYVNVTNRKYIRLL